MSEELHWKVFHQSGEGPIWLLVTSEEKRTYQETYFGCEHPSTEVRMRMISGGSSQRIRQCLTCGRAVGGAVKKNPQANDAPFDTSLVDRAKSVAEADRAAIYELALRRTASLETEGYADYQTYLASEEWAVKRDAVLKRDGHRCQACLSNKATQVHHLTYERIYDEPAFDLVSVCRSCHEKVHAKTIAALAAAKSQSEQLPKLPS